MPPGRARRIACRLLNVFRHERAERELAREIAADLALREDDFQRKGLPPDEARRAAAMAIGGIEQTKELHRDARSIAWIEETRRDALYALRQIRRSPIFAFTAVLSLAIGLGANATFFSIANALLLRAPTGVAYPDHLVDVGVSRTNIGGFNPGSYPNYLDARDRSASFADLYGTSLFSNSMSFGAAEDRGAESVFVTFATTNYFTALGAVPAAGRLFDPRDDTRPEGQDIAVLSHRFWTHRFKSSLSVVGRTLPLDGRPYTIVGVAAEGFQGTSVRGADVWLPVQSAAATPRGAEMLGNRGSGWLMMGARLQPGVSLPEAAAAFDAIGQSLSRLHPETNRGKTLRMMPLSSVAGATGPITVFLGLLMAMVMLVLVVTCANLAGVLLSRATARRREIAVRLAIGAGRTRLIRQLLTETLLLFSLGAAAALVVAPIAVSLLLASIPTLPFPIDVTVAIDGRVIAFTTTLALMAAIICGLVPALQASNPSVVTELKTETSGPSGVGRFRHAFVIAQVACSILLVVIAALFVRALHRAGAMDPGFEPDGLELVAVDLSGAGDAAAAGPVARDILTRVRAHPHVERATLAAALPGGFEGISLGHVSSADTSQPGQAQRRDVTWNVVEPGYFDALRLPLVAGRDFSVGDIPDSEQVAIVGERAARLFYPDGEAIGRTITQHGFGSAPTRALRIVGIARDPTHGSLIDATAGGAYVYVPLQQQFLPRMQIVTRTVDGRSMAADVASIVFAVNPRVSSGPAQDAQAYAAVGLLPQRIAVTIASALGVLSLLLASVGIYGVTAHTMARRTREIGIRLALGAQRGQILGSVLRQSLSLAAIGSAIGLTLAAASSQLLRGYLLGVAPLDPASFAGATMLVVVVSLLASCAPARRAMNVDPIAALRQD